MKTIGCHFKALTMLSVLPLILGQSRDVNL